MRQKGTAMGNYRLGKRCAAALLCGILALSALPTAAAGAYTDTSGHWAESAIEKWSGRYGILNGYDDGTFRPDATITRGAFAGIMARFLQYRTEAEPSVFSDTAGDYWESAILKLNAAGVYLGTEGKALIYHNITRQQAVAMVGRAFGLPEGSGVLPYADGDSVSAYAAGYLSLMTDRGYITDSGDGWFRPTDAITRAEVVNLLGNLIAVLYQSGGTYSETVTGTAMVSAEEGASLRGMTITGDLIVAPGVTGTVTLTDVTVAGEIRNLGGGAVETVQTPKPTPTEGYITYENRQVPILPDVEASTLTAADFTWDERGRLTCISGQYASSFGIDVAAYQNRSCPGNTIDWQAVAEDGVDFAMVRIALRGTSSGILYPDAFYEQNVDGALAAGIQTGVYIFSQAVTVEEAVEEADYVISLLNGRTLTGPVAFDWEMKDSSYRVFGTEPEVATACAAAFCRRIAEAGYQPMVYVSRYVGYFKFDLSQLKGYPLWYPEYKYPATAAEKLYPGFYYQVNYWQYTDAATVNGISGKVDGDLLLTRR